VTAHRDQSAAAPVTLRLSQLGRAAGAGLSRRLEEVGLDVRRYRVLLAVGEHAGCPQRALTEHLRIPPSRVVAILDDLEGRGLVERVSLPSDRRTHALRLTPAGATLCEEAAPVAEDYERQLVASLAPGEREALLGLLDRLQVGAPPGTL